MLKTNRGWWIVACWLALAGMAQAAMYKWVDDKGVTQYTQYPPPDRKVKVMVPPPPPAEDPEAAQKKLESLLQKQDEQRKTAATAEEEQTKTAEHAKQREQNCKNARSNLEKLTTGGRKRIVGADGVATYLTEEDQQTRIAEAKKQIEAFCD
ncbi:MAG: DUF4124 domain-containing protein [Gammaproteobacteria bacterium]|nr:DUF4124 domain-containing protein [Gammaproteobacteria bacterium]